MTSVVSTNGKSEREARATRMAEEGRKAREEYAVAVEARDQNTARLKALRMEKELAEQAAAPPPARRVAKSRAKAVETPKPAAKPRAKKVKAAAKVVSQETD